MTEGGGAGGRDLARREFLGAAASIVLVIVAVVLAVAGGGEEASEAFPSSPRLASLDDVEELAATLGHPIYWSGEQPGEDIELTTEADGSVYLRYLPEGSAVGDPREEFLTVGTYPVPGAQEALERAAAESGIELRRLEDGALILANPSSRGSVYLAYPGSDLQIEVYHPEPGRAAQLIRSGAIEPVGE